MERRKQMQEMLEKKINKPGNWVQTLVKRGITEEQHLKRSCVPLDEILISNHKYELCIRAGYLPTDRFKTKVSGSLARSVNA